MPIKYEIIARGDKYTDKDGKEKTKWLKCGVVIEKNDGRLSMKLEQVPVVSDGWFILSEPLLDKQKQNLSKDDLKEGYQEFDDNLPF